MIIIDIFELHIYKKLLSFLCISCIVDIFNFITFLNLHNLSYSLLTYYKFRFLNYNNYNKMVKVTNNHKKSNKGKPKVESIDLKSHSVQELYEKAIKAYQ